jgi:hypothetical protein
MYWPSSKSQTWREPSVISILSPLPHRPDPAAGARPGLQDRAVVAGLAQFPGRRHARDAGPEDHDLGPLAAAALGQVRRGAGEGRGRRQQAQGLHGGEGGAVAAGRADGVNEAATADRHA